MKEAAMSVWVHFGKSIGGDSLGHVVGGCLPSDSFPKCLYHMRSYQQHKRVPIASPPWQPVVSVFKTLAVLVGMI